MKWREETTDGGRSAYEDRSVFLARQEDLAGRALPAQACFEIICVLGGRCRHEVDGREEELLAGDLCMIPPGEVHLAAAEAGSRVIYILARQENMESVFYNILRDRSEISDFMLDNVYRKDYDSCMTFHTGADPETERQIMEMYEEQQANADIGSDRILASMLVIFLTRLMRKYTGVVSSPDRIRDRSWNPQFLLCIVRDYRTITLSELAKRLNYSVPYCSKYIKETTGYTFLQILRSIRFRKAKDYLCATSLPIQKISALVGYESPENFIRAFKKEYGISPAQYRAQHTQGIA